MSKLTLVMLGLFFIVGGMCGITAYMSSNQAYVEAQPTYIIDVDFGNVFPDETVTSSFTISDNDPGDVDFPIGYKLTLVPNSNPAEDMSIYIYVWKADETDDEIDEWLDGRPPTTDYEGEGTFVDADDEDTWMVTLVVPDVTLPAGVGYDLSCQIQVEPN